VQPKNKLHEPPTPAPRVRPTRIKVPKFGSDIPPFLYPYIETIQDVPRDGHCGYHSIAHQLSLCGIKTDYMEVRRLCMEEIEKNQDFYSELFRKWGWDRGNVIDFIKTIEHSKAPCSRKHWLCLPYMGPVIANVYQQPFCSISKSQSLTHFPWRVPPPSVQPKAITIAFVESSHFVSIMLKDSGSGDQNKYPLPPVVVRWLEARLKRGVHHWKSVYAENIYNWEQMDPSLGKKMGVIEID